MTISSREGNSRGHGVLGKKEAKRLVIGRQNGRFRKRVVLANVTFVPGEHANVPSFRFRFGGTSECTLVPVFVPG